MHETTLLDQSEANPYDDDTLGVLQDYFEERGDDREGVVRMARAMNRIIVPYAGALGVSNYAPAPSLPEDDALFDDDVLDVFHRLQRNTQMAFDDGVKSLTLATAATVRAACESICRHSVASLQVVDQLTINARVCISHAFSQWTYTDVSADVMLDSALTASRGDHGLGRAVTKMVRDLTAGQSIDIIAEPPGNQVYTYRFETGTGNREHGMGHGEASETDKTLLGSTHRIRVYGASEEKIARLVRLVKATVSATQSSMTDGVLPGGGVAWLRGAFSCVQDQDTYDTDEDYLDMSLNPHEHEEEIALGYLQEGDWKLRPVVHSSVVPLLLRGFSAPIHALVSPMAFAKGVDAPFAWPSNAAERERARLVGDVYQDYPASNGLFRPSEMRSTGDPVGQLAASDWLLRDSAKMLKENVVAALLAASSLVGQCCKPKRKFL